YGLAGYALFVAVIAGLEILAIPAIPLTMSAGLLFGYIIGTIIVFISGTVAASVSFLIARYFSRDRILKLAEGNKKFLTIDKTRNATGLVAPAIATSLGALTYTLGTLVPMIGASGFATATPVTAIETVASSFR
ncbi:uncharacterized protein LOC114263488, partial [Camellia sinensis]|uniref:uncharacterized protein LOC114263488 n=1 Tax=Camellia sinensis TaxID=4442 RepID=UPI0010365FCF